MLKSHHENGADDGTVAFTQSEEHWRDVPFEVLPLRTVRRAGRLRRQVQRPLEGYIHVPSDYCGSGEAARGVAARACSVVCGWIHGSSR